MVLTVDGEDEFATDGATVCHRAVILVRVVEDRNMILSQIEALMGIFTICTKVLLKKIYISDIEALMSVLTICA